jgi:hypothetical protein
LRQATRTIRVAPPQAKLTSLENQEEDDDQDNSAEADIHKNSVDVGVGMGMQIKQDQHAFDCKLSLTKTFTAAGDNAD